MSSGVIELKDENKFGSDIGLKSRHNAANFPSGRRKPTKRDCWLYDRQQLEKHRVGRLWSREVDCESSDEEFVIHRKLLRRRHVRKHQIQREREETNARDTDTARLEAERKTRYEQTELLNSSKPWLAEQIGSSKILVDKDVCNLKAPRAQVTCFPAQSISWHLARKYESILFFSPVKSQRKRKLLQDGT